MILAELDATGWSVVIGAFFMGAFKIVELVINYYREKDRIAREAVISQKVDTVAEKQDVAAEKVEQVAIKQDSVVEKQKLNDQKISNAHHVIIEQNTKLIEDSDEIRRLATKTAAFVNGATTTQLQVSAEALRKLADSTNDPKNIHAAEVAEAYLAKHIANQPKEA